MKKDSFDELVVVKRSGQRVNFNGYKIAIAIKSAYDFVYNRDYDEVEVNKIYECVLDYIEKNYSDRKTINVEDIQDIIETEMKKRDEEVYKAFSEYRHKRAESRKVFKVKQQHKFAKAMETIAEGDILKADNNYSPREILIECGKTVASEYTKAYLLDNKYLRAHDEGRIYIHDVASFARGTLSHTHIKLDKQLEKDDSIDNLATYILELKDEVSGEINIPGIDYLLDRWLLEKFKKKFKDYLTKYLSLNGFSEYLNVKKEMDKIDRLQSIDIDIREMEPDLNSIVSNIFDTAYKDAKETTILEIKEAITRLFDRLKRDRGNHSYSVSFGQNNKESGKLINKTIVEYISEVSSLENLAFIYKPSNLDDELLKDIENIIINGKDVAIDFEAMSENEIEHFSNGVRIYENQNEEANSSLGRSVIASTSINMPRLALESKARPKSSFISELDETLDLVKNELLMTFETIGNKSKDNYRFLFDDNIRNDDKLLSGQKIRKVIKDGVLQIGIVGLKECTLVLEKEKDKQFDLLIEILKHLNKRCEEYSASTKLNFAIFEPFDSECSIEFIKVDRAIYGVLKGITDKNKYDLVSNHESLKDDYALESKVSLFFKGGNTIEYEIPKNMTTSKLHKEIEKMCTGNVKFVRFTKDRGFKT